MCVRDGENEDVLAVCQPAEHLWYPRSQSGTQPALLLQGTKLSIVSTFLWGCKYSGINTRPSEKCIYSITATKRFIELLSYNTDFPTTQAFKMFYILHHYILTHEWKYSNLWCCIHIMGEEVDLRNNLSSNGGRKRKTVGSWHSVCLHVQQAFCQISYPSVNWMTTVLILKHLNNIQLGDHSSHFCTLRGIISLRYGRKGEGTLRESNNTELL